MTSVTPAAPARPAVPAPVVFDTGSEGAPQGQLPVALTFTAEEEKAIMNPLQHLPVVGMIYRAITGEKLPESVQLADSILSGVAFGGPIGVAGTILMALVKELVALGPDTSRPPVPEGMDATGAEAAVRPVSPGTTTMPGGYTTLATTRPDFLGGTGGPSTTMLAGLAAYDFSQKAAQMGTG